MAASSWGADPLPPQTAAPHPRAAHIILIPCICEQNAQRVGNFKNPLSTRRWCNSTVRNNIEGSGNVIGT